MIKVKKENNIYFIVLYKRCNYNSCYTYLKTKPCDIIKPRSVLIVNL